MSRLIPPMVRLLGLALLLASIAPWQAAAQVTTPRTCSKSTFYDAATSGATQMVPVATDRYAGNEIFICGYVIATTASAAVNVGLVMGTGTNCATNQVKLTPAWQFTGPVATGFYALVDGQATWCNFVNS